MSVLPWLRVLLAVGVVGVETAALVGTSGRPVVVAAPGRPLPARPVHTDPFYTLLTADDVGRGLWGIASSGHDLSALAPRVRAARAARERVDAARTRRRAAHEATVLAWAAVAEALGSDRAAALARASSPPGPPARPAPVEPEGAPLPNPASHLQPPP